MATRFGGVTPVHRYQTKIKWYIGCLLAVIVVLAVSVVVILTSSSADQANTQMAAANAKNTSAAVNANTTSVLVASQRIEEGTELQDYMFLPKSWEADSLPEGVILARDIQTVRGKFASKLIHAHLPLVTSDVTTVKPLSALNIPPGYRAVTITVDSRSGVEGFARPGARVDVLFTYRGRDARKHVATIVRFVKVLSVGGVTGTNNQKIALKKKANITLLVSERDAKRIELARSEGTLTLSLVGGEEPGSNTEEPEAINFYDLIGEDAREKEEPEELDGVMYTTDPKTGRQVKYVLERGKWVREREL